MDGKLGVRVFFVISGFLITSLLLKESEKRGKISLLAFYKRRALRILPVYYFYILAIAVVTMMGFRGIASSTFASALTFTTELWGNWNSVQNWPLSHTWSLSIEEQFYFTWPALLAILGYRFAGKVWIPLLLVLAPTLRFLLWDQPIQHHLFVC